MIVIFVNVYRTTLLSRQLAIIGNYTETLRNYCSKDCRLYKRRWILSPTEMFLHDDVTLVTVVNFSLVLFSVWFFPPLFLNILVFD